MKIILNGDELINVAEFHKQIKLLLALPDHYGENLDALWDCLTGWIDLPLVLIWNDYGKSKELLGEFAERALKIFKDAEKEMNGFKIECR